MADAPFETPDGRYIIVRGRLWRKSNPNLSEVERRTLVHDLMTARRAKKDALHVGDVQARDIAKAAVDLAKHGLGERGPVWWTDGAPDENRRLVQHSTYAAWYASVTDTSG